MSYEEDKGAQAWPRLRALLIRLQCDGEQPCKRCVNDQQICVSGTRKKSTEARQLPEGQAITSKWQNCRLTKCLAMPRY